MFVFIAQLCGRGALGETVQVSAQWAVDSPEQYAAALNEPAMATSLRSNIRSVYEMAGLSADSDAGVVIGGGLSEVIGGGLQTTQATQPPQQTTQATQPPQQTTQATQATQPPPPTTTTAKTPQPPPPPPPQAEDTETADNTLLFVAVGAVVGVGLVGLGFCFFCWRGGAQTVLYQKVPSAEYDRGVLPVKIDPPPSAPPCPAQPIPQQPVYFPQPQPQPPVYFPQPQPQPQPIQPQQYAVPTYPSQPVPILPPPQYRPPPMNPQVLLPPPLVPQVQPPQPFVPPPQPVPAFAVPPELLHAAPRSAIFELPPHLRVRLSRAVREARL